MLTSLCPRLGLLSVGSYRKLLSVPKVGAEFSKAIGFFSFVCFLKGAIWAAARGGVLVGAGEGGEEGREDGVTLHRAGRPGHQAHL